MAVEDNRLLFGGELSEESATYKYKEKQLYGLSSPPPHLLWVFETEEARNACLFQILTEELDYVGRDLAVEEGRTRAQ